MSLATLIETLVFKYYKSYQPHASHSTLNLEFPNGVRLRYEEFEGGVDYDPISRITLWGGDQDESPILCYFAAGYEQDSEEAVLKILNAVPSYNNLDTEETEELRKISRILDILEMMAKVVKGEPLR